ncbi:MAG TPA: transporter substrate-binding domain-containing protein [Candidatus Eisenbergiella pullistercoris]|uniref:Transporter substrate-binding domain-containing protein n=1 Tax=Candidatus Eisenbergiella pullistercoris TaxID=2838555 RepID=A0A9D1YPE2_9FIRM|nr:transporter substrate-binding domain-containing protein [Candidatus Eisenbergiella pullistercoris]
MAFFFLCMLCAGLLSGCGRREENASQAYSPFSALTVLAADTESKDRPTLADFGTASIGILTGSSYDPLVKERFPEAERVYYSTTTDMILSTEQGKIDGFICDSPYYVAALWEGANLDAVKEPVDQTPVAFAFSKSDADSRLVAQMDEFILTSKENGLLEDLEEKWLNEEEPPVEEHPDYENLSGGNGTITVAVDVESKPLVYL